MYDCDTTPQESRTGGESKYDATHWHAYTLPDPSTELVCAGQGEHAATLADPKFSLNVLAAHREHVADPCGDHVPVWHGSQNNRDDAAVAPVNVPAGQGVHWVWLSFEYVPGIQAWTLICWSVRYVIWEALGREKLASKD